MSDAGSNSKFKWTTESTTLLVSVWTDKQVQKQLEYASKSELIWESIAKYMQKKGYDVTAKQCRSRVKQIFVCYKEAKKNGTEASVERYYESLDKVYVKKHVEKKKFNDNGIDTVDSVPVSLKSPPKEMKTNENLRMRQNKFEEVYPCTWQNNRDEYGDSSESNETVLVRPHRSLSPMRNVGTNTVSETMRLPAKSVRRSLPMDDRFRFENFENNRFAEIPLQSGVQNVHNQIIQEEMMLRNQLAYDNIDIRHQPPNYRVNINPGLRPSLYPESAIYHPSRIATNMERMQSQLQQYSLERNSMIPQESRKFLNMGDNGAINGYKQYQRACAENDSPDIAPNLNDAFCHASKNTKIHNLNETYDQPMFNNNEIPNPMDATAITNNATFNDDTLSIDFIEESPSPTENGAVGTRSNSLNNRVTTPNAPFRKKKAQKLEQLMLNAITSQTEVFNKILETQDVMISRILDIDKNHKDRLENRLDQFINVVQAKVLNNNGESKESNSDASLSPSPPLLNVPLCFSPPPKPGTAPPKLDLVPPKPCRVPCTNPSNTQVINQNSIQTRPGVILPAKPGTIWTKLGPVSQSPFMKAQRQISAVTKATEQWRTRSSAERRIACTADAISDPKTIIEETQKFLQSEKLMESRIENARRLSAAPDREQSARRKLFDSESLPQNGKSSTVNKQPSAAGLLTAAFLDIERENEEKLRRMIFLFETERMNSIDDLLTGQGESYDRLRRLSVHGNLNKNIANTMHDDNMNTSTPARPSRDNDHIYHHEPKQTIQQLGQLVMNSARWRNAAAAPANSQQIIMNHLQSENRRDTIPLRPPREVEVQRQSREKALDWLQDPYSYGMKKPMINDPADKAQNYPMGFVMNNNNIQDNIDKQAVNHPMGFTVDLIPQYHGYSRNPQSQYNLMPDNAHQALQRELMAKYAQDSEYRRSQNKDDDENDDDEFLDTTTTLHLQRKSSLTSTGTSNGTGNISKSQAHTCIIS